MPAAKDGFGRLATGITGFRKALQDVITPELKEHTLILWADAEALQGYFEGMDSRLG